MSIDKITYRLASPSDQALIDDMNVVASLGARMPDADMPGAAEFFEYAPHAAAYSENFGRKGDIGLVVYDAVRGEDVGAIWGREYERGEEDGVMRDHPFEITLAVRESLRGQGIGRQLLDNMATIAWHAGRTELSLGVHERSPARRLYEAAGYVALKDSNDVEARVGGKFIPMVKKI
jgi:GNAT superfamily N-acetyltransferase